MNFRNSANALKNVWFVQQHIHVAVYYFFYSLFFYLLCVIVFCDRGE